MSSLGTLAIGAITYFLKRTINKVDDHDRDIQMIKQTFASKEELKDFRGEFKESINKLSEDVESIKENGLSKRDFYQSIIRLENKIEKLYDAKMNGNGG